MTNISFVQNIVYMSLDNWSYEYQLIFLLHKEKKKEKAKTLDPMYDFEKGKESTH